MGYVQTIHVLENRWIGFSKEPLLVNMKLLNSTLMVDTSISNEKELSQNYRFMRAFRRHKPMVLLPL